jgi:predicted SnoaL-like aldol condensation-catalyzing enzyme
MTSPTTERPADAPMAAKGSNRDIAVHFLTLAASGRAGEAWSLYGAPDFVHHNPYFKGDGPSLIAAMDENARDNPDKVLEVKRTIAEGPLVAVHTWVRHHPGERGFSIIHVFRIEGGSIREMWDVGQEIPAESPNQHGMV